MGKPRTFIHLVELRSTSRPPPFFVVPAGLGADGGRRGPVRGAERWPGTGASLGLPPVEPVRVCAAGAQYRRSLSFVKSETRRGRGEFGVNCGVWLPGLRGQGTPAPPGTAPPLPTRSSGPCARRVHSPCSVPSPGPALEPLARGHWSPRGRFGGAGRAQLAWSLRVIPGPLRAASDEAPSPVAQVASPFPRAPASSPPPSLSTHLPGDVLGFLFIL